MGITLGWVVLLLAGAAGAPPAEKTAAPISYTVKMVEADGVGWRASAMSHLRPVTRQGAATVWTLPRSAARSVMAEIAKNSAVAVVQGPRVTAFSGVPATIQVRENRKFVTQVAWNGDESTSQGSPEQVRVGWHTTIVGRKLDQGILVQIVFEDTEIRGVHKVSLAAPGERKKVSSAGAMLRMSGLDKIAGAAPLAFEKSPFEVSASTKCDAQDTACCNETASDELVALCGQDSDGRVAFELPEIANQEILGEWLIPNGDCLLVSFGPHTAADKAGKAVVRERLAFVEADEQPGVPGQAQAMTMAPKYIIRMAPTAPPPPAPFGAVLPSPIAPAGAFAPNAPNGNTIYSAPFAPTPIGPSAGFAPTPAPEPAGPLPSGRYMHDDVQYMPSGPDFPWANSQAATQRARMRANGVEPPPSAAVAPAPAAPLRSAENLPTPPAPSRTFPQGIHTDGSKAALPPLPEDEKDDESADSESAEPRPSPQTKKPRKPEPEPKAKPEADESANKVSFTKPISPNVLLPNLFLPGASNGFQFLLPIRPLSLKLPFNQRLEIEIFGRVVPDAQSSEADKTPTVGPLSSQRPAVSDLLAAARVMEALMSEGVKWMSEPSNSSPGEGPAAEENKAGFHSTPGGDIGRAAGTPVSSIQQTVDNLVSQVEQLRKQGDDWQSFWLLLTPYDDPGGADSDKARPSRQTKKPRKPAEDQE